MTPVWALLGVGASVLVIIVLVLVLVARRGSFIAAVPIPNGGGPFVLHVPPGPPGEPVQICIRYSVSFPYIPPPLGGKVGRQFALIVDLDIDGQRVSHGVHGRPPDNRPDFEGLTSFMTSWEPGSPHQPSRYGASTLVRRVPTRPRVIQGAVYGEGRTVVNHAEISIRG